MFPLEWKLIGGAALALLLFGGVEWWKHDLKSEGAMECRAQVAAGIAKAQADADEKTATMKESALELSKAHAVELGTVSARLAAATASLRNRPEHRADVPAIAASASEGGTGAGLSGPDARFLSGEAARGNKLRADLAECQAWIEDQVKATGQ